MKGRKGFTLVELMVVILIVGILAAVAIPIMRGRIDSAKWSEGKAMMGTIATAIRAYVAEKGAACTTGGFSLWSAELGFGANDFDGTYFDATSFSITSCTYASGALAFTITGTAPTGIVYPTGCTLTAAGVWSP
jgi:prepilin-type N-terminal cleavage/methylation domain-containing protein